MAKSKKDKKVKEITLDITNESLELENYTHSQVGFNVNINRDDPHLNDYLHVWSKFNNRPSKVVIYSNYKSDVFWSVLQQRLVDGFHKNIVSEVIPSNDTMIYNHKYFIQVNDGIYTSFVEMDSGEDSCFVSDLIVYYNSETTDISQVNEFLESFKDAVVDYQGEEANERFNIIHITSNGMELDTLEIQLDDSDNFDLHYNDNVIKAGDKAFKKIKKSNKGLTIIYGVRGTGKTTYVTNMLSKVDKMVIFIPSTMIEHTVNNPEFRNFLKRYNKSVLVIDDSEIFFSEASYIKANIFVNNLLQMIDGLASDMINVQVITILNTDDESDIDHNLLDCNNLNGVIHFDKLHEDKVKDLSKIYGKSKIKDKARLIDIINNNKIIKNEFSPGY